MKRKPVQLDLRWTTDLKRNGVINMKGSGKIKFKKETITDILMFVLLVLAV